MDWAALVRVGSALLFASALFAKVRREAAFETALRDYRILPTAAVRPAAMLTMLAEAAVTVSVLGAAVKPGLVAAAVLLSVFAGTMALALRKHQPEDCGCLPGALRIRPDVASVFTNLGIAACALAATTQPVVGVPFPDEKEIGTGPIVVIWLSAGLLVMLYWLAAYARTVAALGRDMSTQEVA